MIVEINNKKKIFFSSNARPVHVFSRNRFLVFLITLSTNAPTYHFLIVTIFNCLSSRTREIRLYVCRKSVLTMNMLLQTSRAQSTASLFALPRNYHRLVRTNNNNQVLFSYTFDLRANSIYSEKLSINSVIIVAYPYRKRTFIYLSLKVVFSWSLCSAQWAWRQPWLNFSTRLEEKLSSFPEYCSCETKTTMTIRGVAQ